MATCNLAVEIDDPTRVRSGGEIVTGTVVVTPESDINCNGLEVSTMWSTHGRGNIDSGTCETQTLFQGPWNAGQVYRYPFKLTCASWPPTYFGDYLNVSHNVVATAKLPWKIDPKAQSEFVVVPTETPEGLVPTGRPKQSNTAGCVIAVVIAIAIAAFLPFAIFLLPLIIVGVSLFWFFRKFLPRQISGATELAFDKTEVNAGETLAGTFRFTPKRSAAINGVRWTINCVETCISGSGSNRKTHTHQVLNKSMLLMDACQLEAGKSYTLPLSFSIPSTAPPSLKLKDNELTWNSELRIDIPKWPDWVQATPLLIKMTGESASQPVLIPGGLGNMMPEQAEAVIRASVVPPAEDNDPWLTEVFQQIQQCKDDPEKLSLVIQAVEDQEFALIVETQGEIDEPFDSNSEEENCVWYSAIDELRGTRIALHLVPDVISRRASQDISWQPSLRVIGTMMGYDTDAHRVMFNVLRLE